MSIITKEQVKQFFLAKNISIPDEDLDRVTTEFNLHKVDINDPNLTSYSCGCISKEN